MENFELLGHGEFIKISFKEVYGFPNETSYWGGYDLKCSVKLAIGHFTADSEFYSSTGEIFKFYENLKECNEKLVGDIYFENYEYNLKLHLKYDVNGSISITGSYSKESNRLHFEYMSDQSYIQLTLLQLKSIYSKYGAATRIK